MIAEDWIARVIGRHTASMTRPEFLKAVRALSSRYVERRSALPGRSAIDSAGKRAAFAAFYAPIHFLTAREIVRRLGLAARAVRSIVDLGCGTGVAGAAWALESRSEGASSPLLAGVDLNPWALAEAKWNWSALGLDGRTKRGDLSSAISVAPGARLSVPVPHGIVAAWAMNELEAGARSQCLSQLIGAARAGATVLVIEPIATRLVPWWPAWVREAETAGGRADEWKFDLRLPAPLGEIDEAAGFRREGLTARSVSFC